MSAEANYISAEGSQKDLRFSIFDFRMRIQPMAGQIDTDFDGRKNAQKN
jgi:hypothetical protein